MLRTGLAAVILLSACTAERPARDTVPTDAPVVAARGAAAAFLDRYLDADGRIVRLDQGGDTVSEGQAYGLLLAQVAGDDDAFARLWTWTADHLQRPDGLLAWRADAAQVLDESPASDADVLAAWALLRAGGEHRDPGLRLAAAVLAQEVVDVPGVGPVLAAGPWATGSPATLNPSYWSPAVFDDLAQRTGDAEWSALADTAQGVTGTLTEGGRLLPPDWARVDGSVVTATQAPGGTPSEVAYGLDAQRLLVWLATGCEAAGRELAARARPLLSSPEAAKAIRLRPTGEVLDPDDGSLPLVASAAVAAAAGDDRERDQLLDRADAVAAAYPGYYSSAWASLGRALLTTDLLRACP